ncbi:restriction endonuclease [Ovoidimarina sediminis]|uniref:restriction endonuclease n=1 Tax=Ovoidimarina sediminis TaxID=3079856 RepID=UPI002907F70A|nr:restriction endonuclease [Rhodophyticola sp. MJ-SS7]MDU8945995.1 restriction endonuclease [Rhodophyticola sp. MJ-SS7]
MSEEFWRVGHQYRDKAGVKFEEDELLRWLNTTAGSISNSGGIRFKDPVSGGPVDPETDRPVPAFFVLITRDMSAQHHNPWDDVVDEVSGNIYYWGDAKISAREKLFNQFPGNARIEATNNLRLAGRLDEMPPILHFSKQKSGWLTFNGLCALSDVRHAWFEDEGKPIKNLRILLSILDTETVPAEWLRQRVIADDVREADRNLAPEVWRKVMKGKIERRQVWSSKVRSKQQQVPVPGSDDEQVLDEVAALTPAEFEAFTVAMIDKLPDIVPGLEHRVTRTRRTGDHGIDFFGMFKLPYPIDYEIEFLGEAKRYKTAITPDQVSRLVARLGRGQFGLYFTTSWYSEQTQKEIEADRYPVRLFSGQDIVNILRAGDCVSGGRLRVDWKELALAEVEGHGADGLRPTSLW